MHFEKELNEIDWNFNKATNWEFVMLNAKEQSDESPEDENPEENKEEEEGVIRIKLYMNVATMTYQYWKNQFLISTQC